MAIETKWEESGIQWTCSGDVTRKEFMQAIVGDFYNNEHSDTVVYEIVDCSEVSSFEINNRDALFFAGTDLGRSHKQLDMRVALIAQDAFVLKLMETYRDAFHHINKRWDIRIFTDRMKGILWAKAVDNQKSPPLAGGF